MGGGGVLSFSLSMTVVVVLCSGSWGSNTTSGGC